MSLILNIELVCRQQIKASVKIDEFFYGRFCISLMNACMLLLDSVGVLDLLID